MTTETTKKESPAQRAERYRVLWQASSHEVSRLSNTVKMQAELAQKLIRQVEQWERRFDLLLERK